jgi:hypothetical protein
MELFPMVDASGYQDPRKAAPAVLKAGRAYFEARAEINNLTKLELLLKNFTAEGVADKVLVVSMGDEISLSVPSNPAAAQAGFEAWCTANKVPVPGTYNVSWDPDGVANAKLFYYSNLYTNAYGLDAMSAATALLRKYLVNANIGANYSPMTYGPAGYIENVFFYPVNKGVTMFRKGAMTLPWAEDYAWQSPIGTQQMTTALLDLFRAGTRGKTTATTTQMMVYALAHAPGNTANSWRRNFYNYLSHGMRILNLYEFRPCTASFTENYVDTGYGMYSAVRSGLAELSVFDDIVQQGTVSSGDVGLWCSDAFDIWAPATPPNKYGAHQNTFLAGKRAMYIALLHAELAVDIVVEDDIGPVLNTYKLIVLTDTHVSDAAAVALAAWVKAGGVRCLLLSFFDGLYGNVGIGNDALQCKIADVPTIISRVCFCDQHTCDITCKPRFGLPTFHFSYLPLGTLDGVTPMQVLIGTAGAGLRNELNMSNPAMAQLFGIKDVAMIEPVESSVQFIKQDLRHSVPLGTVSWARSGSDGGNTTVTVPAVAARHMFTVTNPAVVVTATFDSTNSGADGGVAIGIGGSGMEPASTTLAVGKGRADYHGWLPGLAYFIPAIPLRPADRGGTDKAFTHFVPFEFSSDERCS